MPKRKKLKDDRLEPFKKMYERVRPKQILKSIKDLYNKEDVVYYNPSTHTMVDYKFHEDICSKLGELQEISTFNDLGMNVDHMFVKYAQNLMYDDPGKYNSIQVMDMSLNYVACKVGEKNLESLLFEAEIHLGHSYNGTKYYVFV